MKEIDRQYQQVVDDLANEFLMLPKEELAAQPDYGSISRKLDGRDLAIAFWHYRFRGDVDHIVFITDRRLLLPFFFRKFISGVVFGLTTNPRLMTDEETGDYD